MRQALFCGCALATLAFAPNALAQTAGSTVIEEVVVTAQRRAERLEDVPMAISVITPAAAEERGVRNLQDLGQVVAGVQVNFSGAYTYPAIRGVSSLTTGVGYESNVALYVDGFYQPDSTSMNADFANLESIQVLKGPQGALYGRNATGGAFLITTLKPTTVPSGKLDLRYGRFDDLTASGYVSGPITNALRYSLAGYYRRNDGYYDLLGPTGQKIGNAAPLKSMSFRGKLEADLGDNLTATVGYNFVQHEDPRGSMFTQEAFRPASYPAKVGRFYDPRTFFTNRNTINQTVLNEGTLTLAAQTPLGELKSYTGYAYRRIKIQFDFDGTFADTSFSNSRYTMDTFQQGVDLHIDKIDKLDLIVGGSYFYDRTKARFVDSYSTNTLRTRVFRGTTSKAWALFADGSYSLTDRLTFTLGGRYTHETKRERTSSITFPAAAFNATPFEENRSYKNFSPRASLRYELEPGTNIYGQVSRGFRPGFLQGVNTQGRILVTNVLPEKITAYEVGYKTARGAFRFDAAAFYYDYKNLQVGITVPNPLLPTSPLNLISNSPKAVIYGVEGQVTFVPVEHLELNASAAYAHARYKNFTNATGNGLNAATRLNVTGQVQDWSDIEMARAPRLTATLGATYDIPGVLGGDVQATANVKYTSSYVPNNPSLYGPLAGADLANKQRYRQKAYTLVNSALDWTDSSGRYTVGVWVNNLFDVDYHVSINGGASGDYGTWASPRTFGARVGFKY